MAELHISNIELIDDYLKTQAGKTFIAEMADYATSIFIHISLTKDEAHAGIYTLKDERSVVVLTLPAESFECVPPGTPSKALETLFAVIEKVNPPTVSELSEKETDRFYQVGTLELEKLKEKEIRTIH